MCGGVEGEAEIFNLCSYLCQCSAVQWSLLAHFYVSATIKHRQLKDETLPKNKMTQLIEVVTFVNTRNFSLNASVCVCDELPSSIFLSGSFFAWSPNIYVRNDG